MMAHYAETLASLLLDYDRCDRRSRVGRAIHDRIATIVAKTGAIRVGSLMLRPTEDDSFTRETWVDERSLKASFLVKHNLGRLAETECANPRASTGKRVMHAKHGLYNAG